MFPYLLSPVSLYWNVRGIKIKINKDRFWNGRMQIVALYRTRSAATSGKSLYRVEIAVGSLSYARDLLRVERENPLVSYPILDPCSISKGVSMTWGNWYGAVLYSDGRLFWIDIIILVTLKIPRPLAALVVRFRFSTLSYFFFHNTEAILKVMHTIYIFTNTFISLRLSLHNPSVVSLLLNDLEALLFHLRHHFYSCVE